MAAARRASTPERLGIRSVCHSREPVRSSLRKWNPALSVADAQTNGRILSRLAFRVSEDLTGSGRASLPFVDHAPASRPSACPFPKTCQIDPQRGFPLSGTQTILASRRWPIPGHQRDGCIRKRP